MNFNYFISETVFDFLLQAVRLVAEEGWKLLPHYRFDLASGMWRHRRGRSEAAMRLHDNSYRCGKLEYRSRHATEPEAALAGYVEDARRIIEDAVRDYQTTSLEREVLTPETEALRWFPLPSEALAEVRGQSLPPDAGHRVHLGG